MSFQDRIRRAGSAFLDILAELVTQILLSGVALSALFADQLKLNTMPMGATAGFDGKCTVVSYTTDEGTTYTTFGCDAFLDEMSSAAIRLLRSPPTLRRDGA